MVVVFGVDVETMHILIYDTVFLCYSLVVVSSPGIAVDVVHLYRGWLFPVPLSTVAGIELSVPYLQKTDGIVFRCTYGIYVAQRHGLRAVGGNGVCLQLLVLLVGPVAFVCLVVGHVLQISVVPCSGDVVGMVERHIVCRGVPVRPVEQVCRLVGCQYSVAGVHVYLVSAEGTVGNILSQIVGVEDKSLLHVNLHQSESRTQICQTALYHHLVYILAYRHRLVVVARDVRHVQLVVEQVDVVVVVYNDKLLRRVVPCYLRYCAFAEREHLVVCRHASVRDVV